MKINEILLKVNKMKLFLDVDPSIYGVITQKHSPERKYVNYEIRYFYKNVFQKVAYEDEMSDAKNKLRSLLIQMYSQKKDPDDNKITDLVESAETIYSQDLQNLIDHECKDARAFGYYKNKLHIAPSSKVWHSDLIWSTTGVNRAVFDYPGRLWVEYKIISFWSYPNKEKLDEILNDIQVEMNSKKSKYNIKSDIDFKDDWKIELKQTEFRHSELIPLKDFISSDNSTPEELKQRHIEVGSGGKDVFKGIGSKKKKKLFKWQKQFESIKPFESIKSFKNFKLNESPQEINDIEKNININYKLIDSRAFGYYNNKLYIGWNNRCLHKHMTQEFGVIRKDFTYPGRLWLDYKVISFWKYPENNNKLNEILNDIEYNINIDIDLYQCKKWTPINFQTDNWLIEIKTDDSEFDTLIPLKEYIKSQGRSEQELKQKHIEVGSGENVPKGFGSRKHKPIEWKHALGKWRGESLSYKQFNESVAEKIEIDGEIKNWEVDNVYPFLYDDDNEIYFGVENNNIIS